MPSRATRHASPYTAVQPFSRFPEPPPPPPSDQSAAASVMIDKCREMAEAEGLSCRFRLHVNRALWDWWQTTPPTFAPEVEVVVDERLLPGRNLCYVETFREKAKPA